MTRSSTIVLKSTPGIDHRHQVKRGGHAQKSQRNQQSRVDSCLRHDDPGDRHHEHEREPAWRKRHSRAFCRIAHARLQKLRNQNGSPKQHEPQNEREKYSGSEIPVPQEPYVDDRILVVPLPQEERDQYRNTDAEHGDDERRTEPVRFLTFIQNELEAGNAENDQRQADVVDPDPRSLFLFQPRRIFDDALGHEQRNQTDGQVDEKDPVPAIVVRDPAAECWPDRRCSYNGHAVHSERHAALLDRKCIRENRLF